MKRTVSWVSDMFYSTKTNEYVGRFDTADSMELEKMSFPDWLIYILGDGWRLESVCKHTPETWSNVTWGGFAFDEHDKIQGYMCVLISND